MHPQSMNGLRRSFLCRIRRGGTSQVSPDSTSHQVINYLIIVHVRQLLNSHMLFLIVNNYCIIPFVSLMLMMVLLVEMLIMLYSIVLDLSGTALLIITYFTFWRT